MIVRSVLVLIIRRIEVGYVALNLVQECVRVVPVHQVLTTVIPQNRRFQGQRASNAVPCRVRRTAPPAMETLEDAGGVAAIGRLEEERREKHRLLILPDQA